MTNSPSHGCTAHICMPAVHVNNIGIPRRHIYTTSLAFKGQHYTTMTNHLSGQYPFPPCIATWSKCRHPPAHVWSGLNYMHTHYNPALSCTHTSHAVCYLTKAARRIGHIVICTSKVCSMHCITSHICMSQCNTCNY